MAREKLSYAQKQCISSAGKLMQSTQMIHPGARIGVAMSGGMDSWVLMQTLLHRRRIVPFTFEIMALHLNPGFDPESHAPLVPWLQERGIPYHVEVTDHGARGHSPENRNNSPCFYCAMLRRTRLFELCRDYNLTHLAFGHNADDLVGTFFMNLYEGGSVRGMSIKEAFFGGRLMVIRPLMLVEKSVINRCVRQWELPLWSNPCPSAFDSRRKEVMDDFWEMASRNKGLRQNVFNALTRWQLGLTLDGKAK
ncbi:MAG: ATP-binding protein [Halodesulfovibrio sp.]